MISLSFPLPEIFAVSPWDCQHSWGNFDCTWQRISTDTYTNFTPYYWLVIVQLLQHNNKYIHTIGIHRNETIGRALHYFPGHSKHQIEDTEDCKLFVNFGSWYYDWLRGWLSPPHSQWSIQWLKCSPVSITSSRPVSDVISHAFLPFFIPYSVRDLSLRYSSSLINQLTSFRVQVFSDTKLNISHNIKYLVCTYLSTMIGSEGVSFLLPQDLCSRHLLQISSCVSRTRRKSGFLQVPS